MNSKLSIKFLFRRSCRLTSYKSSGAGGEGLAVLSASHLISVLHGNTLCNQNSLPNPELYVCTIQLVSFCEYSVLRHFVLRGLVPHVESRNQCCKHNAQFFPQNKEICLPTHPQPPPTSLFWKGVQKAAPFKYCSSCSTK